VSREEIREKIEGMVKTLYEGADENCLDGDLPFLGQNGMFDSVAALQLILALEREFKLIIEDGGIAPENLSSLDSLIRFVERKLSGSQNPGTANRL
jgi:acyl carrier protein